VFCPNCGVNATTDQMFCRACGLKLEKVVDVLAEQSLETRPPESLVIDRQKSRAERLISFALAGLFGPLILAALYGIIAVLILDKGEVLKGLFLLVFLLSAVATLSMVVYLEHLKQTAKKANGGNRDMNLADTTAKRLPDAQFQPVSSVTERTTDLLANELRPGTKTPN
jgi:hypothetical protein